MQAYYVVAANSYGTSQYATWASRATALGCTIVLGDPTGKVTVFPSAVVMSTVLAPTVFADDTQQATLSEIQTAMSAATSAETTAASQITTAQSTVPTLQQQIPAFQTQIAADITIVTGGWSTLTAADQQAIILRMLNGFSTVVSGLEALGILSMRPTVGP